MNNPYKVLNIGQDAQKEEIIKAQMKAMLERKYSLSEIALAARQLLDPPKRLAADFMYPSKIKSKRPQKIILKQEPDHFDYKSIDINAMNSIKIKL